MRLRYTMVNKFEHCLRSAENRDRRSCYRAVKQRGRVGRVVVKKASRNMTQWQTSGVPGVMPRAVG